MPRCDEDSDRLGSVSLGISRIAEGAQCSKAQKMLGEFECKGRRLLVR